MTARYFTVPWYPEILLMAPPQMPGDGVQLLLQIEAASHQIPELETLLDMMSADTGMERWMCREAVQMAARIGLIGMTEVDFSRAGSA